MNHSIFWKNMAPTDVSTTGSSANYREQYIIKSLHHKIAACSSLCVFFFGAVFFSCFSLFTPSLVLLPLQKGGGVLQQGSLAAAIESKWGSFEAFKATMNSAAAGVEGSGWAVSFLNPSMS